MTKSKIRNIITDKLVLKETGKAMEDWFTHFDNKGARKLSHQQIFELSEITGMNVWNRNLLTTSYEWSRGLKERGEKENGFEISVSKTIRAPLESLYQHFIEPDTRKNWLGAEKLIIRKTTLNKSARITWSDNTTSLSIDFYKKSEGKSQIVVQHQKLPDAHAAAEMKVFWSDKLEKLKTQLEDA